jgi:4'-phosphopantetheinyl transferase EntD
MPFLPFADLLPSPLRVLAARTTDSQSWSTDPDERAWVAQAGESRQAEFLTGRFLAHALLAEFALPYQPLLTSDIGSVVWPEGIVGSITHKQSWCICAVAHSDLVSCLGLDLEVCDKISVAAAKRILRVEESAWTQSQSFFTPQNAATLIFSAKEAFFKAHSLQVLEWQKIHVTVSPQTAAQGTLTASFSPDPNGVNLQGIFQFWDEFVLTAFWELPQS